MTRLAAFVLSLLCVACPCEDAPTGDAGADVGADAGDVLDSLRERFDAERMVEVSLSD